MELEEEREDSSLGALQRAQPLPTTCCWTISLQNGERTNFSCFNLPIHSTLLGQPQDLNTAQDASPPLNPSTPGLSFLGT